MPEGRCVHDLLPGQCAICLGQLTSTRTTGVVVHTFRARYEGHCSIDPTHPINAGDLVGWTEDDVVVCQDCAQAPQ